MKITMRLYARLLFLSAAVFIFVFINEVALATGLSQKIEKLLPAKSKVIEVQPVTSHRALVLWMEDPKTDIDENSEIYSCPQFSSGIGYYSGPTRVSLVDTKAVRIINTVKVTLESEKDFFVVSFKTKKTYWYWYHGVHTNDESEIKPKIMWLMDYNDDGKALEFALFDQESCMSNPTTLIGYSKKQDKVIQYPLKINGNMQKWVQWLFTQKHKNGCYKYEIDFRGRGGCLEIFKICYNRGQEIFSGTNKSLDCQPE